MSAAWTPTSATLLLYGSPPRTTATEARGTSAETARNAATSGAKPRRSKMVQFNVPRESGPSARSSSPPQIVAGRHRGRCTFESGQPVERPQHRPHRQLFLRGDSSDGGSASTTPTVTSSSSLESSATASGVSSPFSRRTQAHLARRLQTYRAQLVRVTPPPPPPVTYTHDDDAPQRGLRRGEDDYEASMRALLKELVRLNTCSQKQRGGEVVDEDGNRSDYVGVRMDQASGDRPVRPDPVAAELTALQQRVAQAERDVSALRLCVERDLVTAPTEPTRVSTTSTASDLHRVLSISPSPDPHYQPPAKGEARVPSQQLASASAICALPDLVDMSRARSGPHAAPGLSGSPSPATTRRESTSHSHGLSRSDSPTVQTHSVQDDAEWDRKARADREVSFPHMTRHAAALPDASFSLLCEPQRSHPVPRPRGPATSCQNPTHSPSPARTLPLSQPAPAASTSSHADLDSTRGDAGQPFSALTRRVSDPAVRACLVDLDRRVNENSARLAEVAGVELK